MNNHFSLDELFARHRAGLSPEREQAVEEHLRVCSKCSELDLMAEKFSRVLKKSPLHSSKKNVGGCLQPEAIGLYLAGRISAFRKHRIEKHLAACNRCCKDLANLLRLQNSAFTKDDYDTVKTLPDIDAKRWVAAMFERADAEKDSPTEERANQAAIVDWLKEVKKKTVFLFSDRPVWQYAASIAVLAVIFFIGVPFYWGWKSEKLAEQGMRYLEQSYNINVNDLRIAGSFQPSRLSRTRAPEEPRVKSALDHFAQSLEFDASNREAIRGQALVAYFTNNLSRSSEILNTLRKQHPKDASVLNDFGVTSHALGHPTLALDYFEQAIAIEPAFTEALFNRAMVLEKIGQIEEAKSAWQAYLDLNEGGLWHDTAKTHLERLQH